MFFNNAVDLVRELAKKSYYQTLFSQAKELGLQIFQNNTNFTYYQTIFLNYLSFYNSLLIDIYTGEVDEMVLDNTIYEDAYHHYKSAKRKKDMQKSQSTRKKDSSKKEDTVNQFSWNFKTKK